MAEAIARHMASDVMIPASAGTIALGTIAPFTTRILEDRGYDASFLESKPLTKEATKHADIIVNMTGVANEPHFKQDDPRLLEWQILDPYNCPPKDYRTACDEIEIRIAELAARIRGELYAAGIQEEDFSAPEDGDSAGDSASGTNPA
jgi:protein-tyrosine-phosphatase